MPIIVNMHEAKTQLSKLVSAAESGEEVIIARAGKPSVRIVQVVEVETPKRVFGHWEGQGWIADDFLDEVSIDDEPDDPLNKLSLSGSAATE
jgi:prevent-host-death family protein